MKKNKFTKIILGEGRGHSALLLPVAQHGVCAIFSIVFSVGLAAACREAERQGDRERWGGGVLPVRIVGNWHGQCHSVHTHHRSW